MKPSFAMSAPALGLVFLVSAGCSTIQFGNDQKIAPGHEQCIQGYVDRARALKEERGGDPDSIEDALDAKEYAMVIDKMSPLYYPVFGEVTPTQHKEAAAINHGLWVSEHRQLGVPGVNTTSRIHCRGYSPSIK